MPLRVSSPALAWSQRSIALVKGNVPQHRAIDSLLIQTLASSVINGSRLIISIAIVGIAIIGIAIVAGFEITFVILATERLIDVLLD
ncbi:hypothetical protein ACJ41O_002952 [Fusarium nematophilum]